MSDEVTITEEQRAEPILTPAERDHWNIYTWSEGNWLRRNPGAGNKRLHAETMLSIAARLSFLESAHARLIEHTDSLLKDRNEWQAAFRAEQERHDATIHELQAVLTERARLVEENHDLTAALEETEHNADSEIAEVEHDCTREVLGLGEQIAALRQVLTEVRDYGALATSLEQAGGSLVMMVPQIDAALASPEAIRE